MWKQATVCWYVDDNKISHVDTTELINEIESHFGKMTVMRGKKHMFLGMDIDLYMDIYMYVCVSNIPFPTLNCNIQRTRFSAFSIGMSITFSTCKCNINLNMSLVEKSILDTYLYIRLFICLFMNDCLPNTSLT